MIAERNAKVWKYLDDNLRSQIERMDKYSKKIYDNPYTENQQKSIKEYGLNANLYINTYAQIIDALVGQAYAGKGGLSVIGDPQTAFMWQVILTGLLQRDKWMVKWYNVLVNKYSKGLGIIYVDKDDDEINPYGCTIRSINPIHCRWDSRYSDMFWEDADMLALCNWLSVKQAIVMTGERYSEKMEEIILNYPESFRIYRQSTTENKLVPYVEVFSKEYKNYLELIRYNKDKSSIISRREIEDVGGLEDSVVSYFTSGGLDKEEALKYISEIKSLGSVKELRLKRVVKNVSVGGYDVGSFELPTKHYPLIPVPFKIKDNGEYIGVAEAIDGISTTINHTMLIQVINGWTSCGNKVLLPGSDNDPAEISEQMSKPNAVINYSVYELSNGQAVPPTVLSIPNNNSAINDLMIRLMDYLQASTNVSDLMQGMYPGLTPPSGEALYGLRESGSRIMKPQLDINEYAIAQMGRVLVDYVRAFSQSDKIVRILTEDEVILEGLKQYDVQARQVNHPNYNIEMPINKTVQDGDNIIIINDIKNKKYDIDFTVISAYHDTTAKQQVVAVMNDTIRQAPQTAPVLLGKILKLLNFPQAAEVGKALDDREQLVMQIDSLQNQVKALKHELKRYMEQNFRARTTAEVAKFKSDLESLHNDIQLLIEKGKAGDTGATEEARKKVEEALNTAIRMTDMAEPVEQFIDQNITEV